MSTRVLSPPEPIVLPSDIPGSHAEDDQMVAAMIAAVTAEIDGPEGWLGRCIGPQTIEWRVCCWADLCAGIPYPPLIGVDSISYDDETGADVEVDQDLWGVSGKFIWFRSAWSFPCLAAVPEPVKIVFRAGYNDQPLTEDGGTGPIPAQVKQAVILSVQYLKTLGKDDLFMRVDEVEGVGRREYTVSEQAGTIIRTAADRLLAGLRQFT
ncbi:hypothetical protein G6K88_07705 [Agrobacterium rhizogenes]|uniref:hypothetical protein n=1 Tax=Rhizobium rhizogenes TaxID=359 RepID=UPI001573E891|nr:hypothetical protein [Rhizobium rhizogenes]NTF80843.1 hypothetical protein [Rhizobium rhizogenes]NTI01902.1 hypothetical protein [Rhizobium rhizogenes]NTI08705.1 hypothetical protein [Rhizobium rhizogenes]